MACKACGRNVPLEDINCFDCNAEGPFTRADRLTPWRRQFVIATRVDGRLVWFCWVERRVLSVFGRDEQEVRLAERANQ